MAKFTVDCVQHMAKQAHNQRYILVPETFLIVRERITENTSQSHQAIPYIVSDMALNQAFHWSIFIRDVYIVLVEWVWNIV